MKKIYSLLFLLTFTFGIAQIPSGYYTSATGSGYALKTQLYNIIKDHSDNGYAGLYTTYETSDIDNFYENDGTVLDMYSENPAGTDPYSYSIATTQRCGNYTNEGDCYNREHIIPQSVFNEQSPMVADAHFITPTDGKVNGIRSNYPHSVVVTPTTTSLNGSKLGESTTAGYTGPVFEPIDEFKGDIARMYFYFATRYENTVAGYSYAMFNGTSNKVFTPAFLSVLIAWHNQDPVNAREIARNNAIYARQNNRNPYIDHPEYVAAVWTTEADDTTIPTSVTDLAVTATTSNSVNLSWTAATDNIAIASYAVYVNNIFKQNETGTTANITGLTPSTTYSFYVIAKDTSNNLSLPSSTVTGTTSALPSGTTDCAKENFTNIPTVTPSSYTTRTWTGDSGLGYTATDARTDQTLTTKAICIRNGSLTASKAQNGIGSLTVTTQLKFTGTSGTFNLRVNGNIVRTIPYSTTVTTTTISDINISGDAIISFTDNSVTTNRVAIDDLSWTCYSNLNNETFEQDNFIIYPNPSNGHFTIQFNNSNESGKIEILSVLGEKVFEKENSNLSAISINSLAKGIYFVRINQDSKTTIKKIIIN